MSDRRHAIVQSIERSAAAIAALARQAAAIDTVCELITSSLRAGHKILTAGHGGSAAQALHMSEELMGRFKADRRALPAVALVADPTLLTCIANDMGFAQVFPRQVEALGDKGDVLVMFSTSGKGDGFALACASAKRKGVTTVALLGKGGGPLAGMVDHAVVVAEDATERIQEVHTLILHLILEDVEREFA